MAGSSCGRHKPLYVLPHLRALERARRIRRANITSHLTARIGLSDMREQRRAAFSRDNVVTMAVMKTEAPWYHQASAFRACREGAKCKMEAYSSKFLSRYQKRKAREKASSGLEQSRRRERPHLTRHSASVVRHGAS